METDQNKLMTEARARIIWGEASLSVRDFLIANGMSETVADAKIKEFSLERIREIRQIGIGNIIIGTGITVATSLTIYLIIPHFISSGFVKILAMLVVGAMYGLWKLVTGIAYLVRPKVEHKSIPDIVDSDILD